MAETKLNSAKWRVLKITQISNEARKMPSSYAILLTLHGDNNTDQNLLDLSISKRRLNLLIKELVSCGLLRLVYDSEQDDRYYAITNEGIEAISSYSPKKRKGKIKPKKKFIDLRKE